MLVLDGKDCVPESCFGCVLALGNFDGVHHGHRQVLSASVRIAREMKRPAGAILLTPHPQIFFRPGKEFFCLTPDEVKQDLLSACGVDFVAKLQFDSDFAALEPDEFVERVLLGRLRVSHVVMGENFHFGRGRQGDSSLMCRIAGRVGMGATVVAPVAKDGIQCSSSVIRTLLSDGNVSRAASVLGYDWFVRGQVISGDQRGRELGMPTANMFLDSGVRLLHGVYAVRLYRRDDRSVAHDGVANFGIRPTFGESPPTLETHIFDFSDNLYGSVVEVAFVDFIRSERRFGRVEDLVGQMREDCTMARDILRGRSAGMPLVKGWDM